jgi:hypothetical protein
MLDQSGNLSRSLGEEEPKHNKVWDIVLGVVIGLIVLCCLLGAAGGLLYYLSQSGGLPDFGDGQSAGAAVTVVVATDTPEMVSTATLIPTATPESLLLFDDFSNETSGLSIQKDDEKLLAYTETGYRIAVFTPKRLIWAPLGGYYTDMRIEVDVTRMGGPMVGDVGVICRLRDENNFYAFVISGDGYYAVRKYVNGLDSLVGMEERMPSDSIHRGNIKNHIRVECSGPVLRLYANDNLLIETADTSLIAGDVALVVGTLENPGVDALFNRLEVHTAAP